MQHGGARHLFGAEHPVFCINKFFDTSVLVPSDVVNNNDNFRKRWFLFFADIIYLFGYNDKQDLVWLDHKEYDNEYVRLFMVVVRFLKSIEKHLKTKIMNIYLFLNQTVDDTTSVTPWHDDIIGDHGNTRQLSILLLGDRNTEFATSSEHSSEHSSLECHAMNPGAATYWRNGYLHRKPQNTGKRLTLLVVFDFITDTSIDFAFFKAGTIINSEDSKVIMEQLNLMKQLDISTNLDYIKEFYIINKWDKDREYQKGGQRYLSKHSKVALHNFLAQSLNEHPKHKTLSKKSIIQILSKLYVPVPSAITTYT